MGGSPAALPRVLVVEHEDDVGLGRLLPAWRGRLELDVRRPPSGRAGDALPGDLHDHDALVVLGGRAAAWEDERAPHLPRTRALLAQAAADGVPALGICLGAQLLALATGGSVERGGSGTEVGVALLEPTPQAQGDALLGALPRSSRNAAPSSTAPFRAAPFRAAQAHGDTVTRLPPGAVLLATGAMYPVQAFRVGAAWGLQYHPEVTGEGYRAWLGAHAGDLAALGQSVASAVAAAEAAEADLAALAGAHAAAFASVVHAARGARADR